ncbi:MAG: hypothetical protein HUU50_18855 [Candidatus Brocadiae bacterium]|nr:hypothetical protein [Candidatus Brocadiia bacterium]
MNICVVCSGNICRSPVAHYILQRELGNRHIVFSAGTLGIVGSSAYQECVFLAPYYKINLTQHKSQGITLDLLNKSDIFLTMTKVHSKTLVQIYKVPQEKINLLSNYLPENRTFNLGILGSITKGDDIPDPMGMESKSVKPVLDILELACIGFAKSIQDKQEIDCKK